MSRPMTRDETIAYNAGVHAVLALAVQAAGAIESLLVTKPTRYNFAHGALLALAGEGLALVKDVPALDEVIVRAKGSPLPSA